ncbi:MAG: STAS domain-containing protein [Candidatus Omnitrophica bacterium]|nr:STAS domain-containing protein [Candidatus Omnitrophota bacterium]
MPRGIDISISKKGDRDYALSVVGRIDSETYLEFEKTVAPVLEANPSKVLVDLAQCHYISSAGIRVLFDLRKQIITKRGVLSFCNLQPQIRKIFEIIKALPLECVFSNEAEADAYLDRMIAEDTPNES